MTITTKRGEIHTAPLHKHRVMLVDMSGERPAHSYDWRRAEDIAPGDLIQGMGKVLDVAP